MAEEILPNLYRIEIPLPQSPLKTLNSYLIKGCRRFLLIDTGMNREECARQTLSELEKLDVNLKKADFFITHLHVDHLGLVGSLATDTSLVYFNQKEANMVNSESSETERRWQELDTFYVSNGFPEDELKKALESRPAHQYGLSRPVYFSVLGEGDTIEI